MNEFHDSIKMELRNFRPENVVNLVIALVNIAAAIKKAAETHPIEQRDLMKLFDEYDDMLTVCMQCPIMEEQENVLQVLLSGFDNKIRVDDKISRVDNESRAWAFRKGPLKTSIEYALTKFLATPQIIRHVDSVFEDSLKGRTPHAIRNLEDLFQLRSGCSIYRFIPLVMFTFESIMKFVFLIIVAMTSFIQSSVNNGKECRFPFFFQPLEWTCIHSTFWENFLVLMFITSLLYEIGEMANRVDSSSFTPLTTSFTDVSTAKTRESQVTLFWKMVVDCWSESFNRFMDIIAAVFVHVKEKWNVIDCVTIAFIGGWVHCNYFHFNFHDIKDSKQWAETFLALSTISLSLSILRFQSMWKQTGQLVIMVFEMMVDLGSLLLVYLTLVFGFGIAFFSLAPEAGVLGGQSTHNFSNSLQSFLTLYDATLGQHDFGIFSGADHETVAIGLMVLYIALAMIILLNLVVARMSATHEKIDKVSHELWARIQASNVSEFILLYERHSFCMLPPPFNILSITVSYMESALDYFGGTTRSSENESISWSGTVSDRIVR